MLYVNELVVIFFSFLQILGNNNELGLQISLDCN